jgi:hypothetical protein
MNVHFLIWGRGFRPLDLTSKNYCFIIDSKGTFPQVSMFPVSCTRGWGVSVEKVLIYVFGDGPLCITVWELQK